MLNKRGLYLFDCTVFGDTLEANVVNSRFFMSNINQHKRVIGEICRLHAQEKDKRYEKHRLFEKTALNSLQTLITLHHKENKILCREYIAPFVEKYPFLNDASSLTVIDKLYHENYHSLFLKYIWNNQRPHGNKMFSDFLKEINIDEWWLKAVQKNNYRIECEHCIKDSQEQMLNHKRIDLLFVDEANKWLIVIENKIRSEVRFYSDGKYSQLDAYQKYCRKNRKFRDYKTLHILLSYNKKNTSYIEDSDDWKNADYYQVFKSLLKYTSTDTIITDYAKTLFAILFPQKNLNEAVSDLLHRNTWFYHHVISKLQ